MRRWGLPLAGLAGLVLYAALLPLFRTAQPDGLEVTRSEARRVADAEARALNVDIDRAFAVTTWESSSILEKEFRGDAARRRAAAKDPVVGPRLGGFKVTYFRLGLEKFPPWAEVVVGVDGKVLWALRRFRAEETGASPSAEALRPKADAFLRSRAFPGAPTPVFEEVRPTVLRGRTDHLFRFRVTPSIPTGDVVFYLGVEYAGEELAGWSLLEEYADGSGFRGESGGNVAITFLRFGLLFALLIGLVAVFLRKYHAGEAGVETAGVVFAVMIGVCLLADILLATLMGYGTGLGSLDGRWTTWATAGFRFLFYDLPLSLLVFVAWSVGESVARERWGARLASFDAVLKRDVLNATVGGAVLSGAVAAPAIAAATLLAGLPFLLSGRAYPALGDGSIIILGSAGSSLTGVVLAIVDALAGSSVVLLCVLGSFWRKGRIAAGVVLAVVAGAFTIGIPSPIGPAAAEIAAGAGGAAAAIAVFLASDLLAAAVAIFGAILISGFAPLLPGLVGAARVGPVLALLVPLALLIAAGAAGLVTRRRVAYSYDDLAPHVKRIMERERIKAEIDAANRIQAALLPRGDPDLAGASIASHYRAATEIGGDYFDFLPLPDGSLGLVCGDVSGHGLTSGIVMAMAKSALLVQVGYDASPRRVLEVLNETVMKTAPKRILMTFFFGVLDLAERHLVYSSAGHLDPYVFRAKEGRIEALSAWGFPLGVRRRTPFAEHEARFEPGDRLVLYSDGLIEALDDHGEPFGFDRFEELLAKNGDRPSGEIRRVLLDAVATFTRNRPPEDDQTLVVVSFEEAEEASGRLRRAG
ncbi:MAG: PP2C family protein-serine/threonine phosphatase [Thermoanaerobaculia bacterium]